MRFPLVLCLLAVCMTVPIASMAQPGPMRWKSDAITDQARELFVNGVALYDDKQYKQAEVAFLAAWALKKHYQIAGNLGVCEMKLGRYRNAAEHLAFFLRELPPSDTDEERKRAQALFDKARAKVAAVGVWVGLDGVEVRVDGQVVGTTPLAGELFVEPGKRTIEATGEGYTPRRKVIEARAGDSVSLTLTLAPPGLPLSGPPPAQMLIIEPVPRSKVPTVILGGAAFVAVGVGAGFLVVGSGKAAEANALLAKVRAREGTEVMCPKAAECAEIKALRSAHDTDVGVGVGLLIAGGAALAAGVTYALWPVKPRVSLLPVVSTAASGVSLQGAF